MTDKKYVVSIDQGTTGSTVLVIDRKLSIRGRAAREFRQIFPKPGQVEHDLEDIWGATMVALKGALRSAGAKGGEIAAIGITNQRETTALWDRSSGKPVMNAIVWQDRRTAQRCKKLRDDGKNDEVRRTTGLVIDPYFSATKLEWMLTRVKGAARRARAGDLAFGTIDSYLVWRLTGGAVHVTDVTNASRTLLMHLRRRSWDRKMLDLFGVPEAVLPEIRSSSEVYGETRGVKGLPDGIPIAGIAGDQQAALFGQACFEPGEAKCTYGTGAFLLMNIGGAPKASRHGLLTTVAWEVGGEVSYAFEGSAFIAGAIVQWLRDGLKLFKRTAYVERLAMQVEDSGGVVLVPALAGLGAPHWRPEARGLISGIHRGTTTAHLARAALEGIAFQIHDLAVAMAKDAGQAIPSLKVDGGASSNDIMMQFQADLLGVPVVRSKVIETTAFGAAFLAGLATDVWDDPQEIKRVWRSSGTFRPKMKPDKRNEHLSRWQAAVEKA